MSAPQPRRLRRLLASVAGAVIVLTAGFTLMSSPAGATTGDTSRIDTSATTVETQASALTRGGNDDCTGDKCERINWCPPGDKGHGNIPKPLASDAPAVRFGNGDKGGDKPKCIKFPDIVAECCVPDKNGTADVVVTVKNPNHKGGYKVRVQIRDQVKEEWVEAGKTVKFTFTGLGNGKYDVKAAVWLGKGSAWCAFKPCPIVVKCAVPTTPPTTVPTTVPTTTPTTAPTTVPPTSTLPTSDSPEPSASTSTTPVPGGGGGDNEPSLPVTGPVATSIAVGGGLVLFAGLVLFVLARRRRVNFTA